MHFTLAAAETLVVDALTRNRVDEANARSVARALVAAEAAGQGGHGLRRVEAYAKQAKAGKVDGFARPQLERQFPAVVRIDACHGYASTQPLILPLQRFRRSSGNRVLPWQQYTVRTTPACLP